MSLTLFRTSPISGTKRELMLKQNPIIAHGVEEYRRIFPNYNKKKTFINRKKEMKNDCRI